MHFRVESAGDRREFFRASARYALLGLMALAAGFMARRGKLSGKQCVNQGVCGGCGEFTRCELPLAIAAKQSKRGTEL